MPKASKIIADLAELDPGELKQIAEILQNIEIGDTSTIIENKEEVPPKRKRTRTRKKKVSNNNDNNNDTTKKTKTPTKRKRTRKKKKATPTPTPKTNFDKSNKFLTMGIKERVPKEDRKITQAIKAGKIQITERDRPLNFVNATCSGCQTANDVHVDLVYKDPETRKYMYVCNTCLMNRRKN